MDKESANNALIDIVQSFDKHLINERPKDMSYEDYKFILKFQKAYINSKLKGTLVYKASEIMYLPSDVHKQFGLKQTFPPFVGKVKEITEPILHNND